MSFAQTGIDRSAGSNAILMVGSTNYAYNALPNGVWVVKGTTFSWFTSVSAGSGKRFLQTGSSPISAAGVYSAPYKTQYKVTFANLALIATSQEQS